MTYCVERTTLLVQAGRERAERLLPTPFKLWFSCHDTGTQMTIVADGPKGGQPLIVWRGSIWKSHIYEFNDRSHTPGLQPDFAFAKDVIDKYFADVEAEVATAFQARAQRQTEQKAAAEAAKLEAINSVKAALT